MAGILHRFSFLTGKAYEAERREEKMFEEEIETVWFLKTRPNWLTERLKPVKMKIFFSLQ